MWGSIIYTFSSPSGSSSPAGDTHLLYGILFPSRSLFPWHPLKKDFLLIASIWTTSPHPPYQTHPTPTPRSSTTTASQEQPILIFIPHTLISSVQSKENEYSMKCPPFSSSTHSGETLCPDGCSWPLCVFPFIHTDTFRHTVSWQEKKDTHQKLQLFFNLVLLALQGHQRAPRRAGSGNFLDYWLDRGGRPWEFFLLCGKW